MFREVEANVSFPQLELEIGRFWKERGIYEKSLAQREGAEKFVFFEGPPTANGLPHPGHCLTRAIKDLYPRYQTMRGKLCERKAGWDTHGLPVEVEVCKELGIHAKEEIEAYGIEPFIQKCQQSVWRYMQEWERLTERLGFWIHSGSGLCHLPPELCRERLVVAEEPVQSRIAVPRSQDRLVVGSGRHGAQQRGEVGQGYREVADPSVYVGSPCLDERRPPTRACWSGPQRPGRCPATTLRPCILSWSTPPLSTSETGSKADRGRRIWSTRSPNKTSANSRRRYLLGGRPGSADATFPLFDFYYKADSNGEPGQVL